VAWLTGEPFLFPSLGPTAFVLSLSPERRSGTAWTVLGGHFWGTAAGLLSYHLLAAGTTLADLGASDPTAGLLLASSAALSTALTSALMLYTRAVHPPACATTLIVSLGLLPTLRDGGVILLAVTILYALSRTGPFSSDLSAGPTKDV
jgi:CBS-domain-containing membrane protein